MIPNFTIKHEKREKKGFNASDAERMAFDIYHAFKGTEPTNPPKWNDTLKFGAGKGVELQMVKVLKDSGIIDPNWNQEEDETHEMEREGVKVRMRMDTPAILPNEHGLEVGSCVEIKSINNKNSVDIKKYAEGNPRSNYVMQLAIYMDYLQKDIGYLFVASVDGLSYFFFTCRKTGDGLYECGNTKVNIKAEYQRWAGIQEQLKNGTEPVVPFRYKIPVGEVDWSKVSKTDIAKARAGHKVIGDEGSWAIAYSPYKDLIIKAQGVEAGYNEEELAIINAATRGYTSKAGITE
jgi:hypothetical protein